MRLSEVLRRGYSHGTPTVCGKRGRHSLEDLLEVDAVRARHPSFRAGPDLNSPQLDILAAARYLSYGSHRTPTVCQGTATTPSSRSSSAAAAVAEAEGAASSIPSITPTPSAAGAAAVYAGTAGAASDTAAQLVGSVPHSGAHPRPEHLQYAPAFPGVQPTTYASYTEEEASQLAQQHMTFYTAQQLQHVQPPLTCPSHHQSPAWHQLMLMQQQQQQHGCYYFQQQPEFCYAYQLLQLGNCLSSQQQQQLAECYPEQQQQQLARQCVGITTQGRPAAQTSVLLMPHRQQQQQQQAQQQLLQYHPQLQQQQDPYVMYVSSSIQEPGTLLAPSAHLPFASQIPSSHLPVPFRVPARDLPLTFSLQITGAPAACDTEDQQAGLSDDHRDDQDDVIAGADDVTKADDDVINTDDDLMDDDFSDNGTELGSEFDSELENLVDQDVESADGDDDEQSEGAGFDSEGTSDFEDALDGYGTTEEEEENNSIPPAELEAILAENAVRARLWGHLADQGPPQGIAA